MATIEVCTFKKHSVQAPNIDSNCYKTVVRGWSFKKILFGKTGRETIFMANSQRVTVETQYEWKRKCTEIPDSFKQLIQPATHTHHAKRFEMIDYQVLLGQPGSRLLSCPHMATQTGVNIKDEGTCNAPKRNIKTVQTYIPTTWSVTTGQEAIFTSKPSLKYNAPQRCAEFRPSMKSENVFETAIGDEGPRRLFNRSVNNLFWDSRTDGHFPFSCLNLRGPQRKLNMKECRTCNTPRTIFLPRPQHVPKFLYNGYLSGRPKQFFIMMYWNFGLGQPDGRPSSCLNLIEPQPRANMKDQRTPSEILRSQKTLKLFQNNHPEGGAKKVFKNDWRINMFVWVNRTAGHLPSSCVMASRPAVPNQVVATSFWKLS